MKTEEPSLDLLGRDRASVDDDCFWFRIRVLAVLIAKLVRTWKMKLFRRCLAVASLFRLLLRRLRVQVLV